MQRILKIFLLLLSGLFVTLLLSVIIYQIVKSKTVDNSCNYDKDCDDKNCCINNICKKCSPLGPTENNLNDPQIVAFIDYLQTKMDLALKKYVASGAAPSANSNIGLGIYIKNTPYNKGAVKTWWNWQGNTLNNTANNTEELCYYFGSGTKPLTSMMVVGQLYKVWRKKYPKNSVKDFIIWYAGNLEQPGSPDAITYGKLFEMTNGFENSNFTETLTRPSNTQAQSTGESITQTMKEWLFCCEKDGLIPDCKSTGIFCNNTCDNICPIALDTVTYGASCESPFCPNSICDWAWYSDYTKSKQAKKDPNEVPFQQSEYCSCNVISPSQYQHIFKNLSIFDVSMMRSGIPDSDSIWGIDTSAQLSSRTCAIGPVQFVSEIIGFDWNPLWKDNSVKENYVRFTRRPHKPKQVDRKSLEVKDTLPPKYTPMTKALGTSIGPKNTSEYASKYPAKQYSSSAYTFLGILLWLLYDNKNKDDWTKIDLNQLLPRKLRNNINFAGTEGNNGSKYFDIDSQGNRYYSFEKTISIGNIIHPEVIDGTPIGETQTDLSNIKTSVYKRILPDGKTYNFVDWDSSSGVSCGNGWGKCSDMAEIYMNILSPNADNPIVGDKELQKEFTSHFTNYNGDNWEKLWNNQIRAPWCLGANAWSQNMTYNCGVMGPDWFYIYDYPNSYTKYGIIPCYGHLGATYGFNSGHVYFPGGKITGYKPYLGADWNSNYSSKNWNMVFDFCGGNEFTISQAHNNSNDDQSGAIQYLVTELIKDPFIWHE